LVLTLLAAGALVRLIEPVSLMLKRRDLPPDWAILRPPRETSALTLRGDLLLAGGLEGLTAIDRRRCEVVPLEGAPDLRSVRDLLVDKDGSLWVAHSQGIDRLDGDSWSSYRAAQGLPAGAYYTLLETRQGELLAGGESGIVRWREGRFEPLVSAQELGLAGVDVLFEDSREQLWAASMAPAHGGLVRRSRERWENLSPKLAHPSVTSIYEDHDGSLWFGTGFGRRGGLSILREGEWRHITKADGLAGEKVRSIFRDSRGRYWIGSEYDGIVAGDGTKWQLLTPESGLAGWEIKEIVEDPDGFLWFGTEDGVSRVPVKTVLQSP
jgi:ligand-binding sensor domain-containing protein